MAGFYGRVTNQSKTSMTFDRIYGNRKEMKENAARDGVFTGRFVLVEYDEELPIVTNWNEYVSWYNGNGDAEENIVTSNYTNSFVISKLVKLNDHIINAKGDASILIEPNPTGVPGQIYKVAMYNTNPTNAFNSYNDTTDPDGSLRNLAWTNWSAEHYINNRYFMVSLLKEPESTPEGKTVKLTFDDITEFVQENGSAYQTNYNIDKEDDPTHNIGRGYDSTVWRKIINSKGEQDYVMLAELNSVVPTFGLTVDAPTGEPIAPHFGKDLSNVYYPLHIQGNWGFRIAEAHPDKLKTVDVDRNDPSDTPAQYPVNNYDGSVWTEAESPVYNGAIYFNKNGFDPKFSSASGMSLEDNEITMTPTGYSQKKYEVHDANHSLEERPDIQELRIILPALGDAVNEMYNKMYGESKGTTSPRKDNTAWEDANERKDKERITSLALVHGVGDLGYVPADASTLAGTINSVHDIMGMIITEDERPENANLAYHNQIYYDAETNSYWCVVDDVTYDDVDITETTVADFKAHHQDKITEIQNLQQYGKNNTYYFIKADDTPTYVLSKKDNAIAGEIYYTIPTTLTFAGNMVASRDGEGYYAQTANGYAVDNENGEYVIALNSANQEMYKITPGEELYHTGIRYFTYNNLYHAFTDVTNTITANNFDDKVGAGLYAIGSLSKKPISLSSTGYYIRYTASNGDHMQPLGGISRYTEHLNSERDFINYITQVLQQDHGSNITIDFDNLYMESGIMPDTTNGGYIIKYSSTPITKILFASKDSAGNYANVYTKANTTYTKASPSNLNDETREYSVYRLFPIKATLYEDNKYWYIDVADDSPVTQEDLEAARENQNLTTINTNNLKINKITKSRDGFVADRIYWTLNETQFKEFGYGINTSFNEEKETSLIKYYTPNTLYYQDEFERYVLADNNYEFDEENSQLFRVNQLFITDTGDLSNLRLYSHWNNDLIQTNEDITYFFTTHGVKIGYQNYSNKWKELDGFARDLNTIHGWIIRLNRLLNSEDIRSRDINTLQGSINTLKDIIAKFDELIPGTLLGVNKFGQVESISVNGDTWILPETHVDSATQKAQLSITHKNNDFAKIAENHNIFGVNQDGAKVNFIFPIIDDTGHVVGATDPEATGEEATTFTLPFGYKTISGTTGTATASNTADTIAITGDNWLSTAASTNSLVISHSDAQSVTVSPTTTTLSFGDNFSVATLGFDAKGHKGGESTYTITLPAVTISDAVSNGADVITAFGFTNGTTATFSTTRTNIGALALTGYTAGTSTAAIEATDTLNAAIGKLQKQIDAHVAADEVTSFSTTSTTSASNVVASLTLSNGNLAATTINANDLLLTGYVLAGEPSAVQVGIYESPIVETDSIGQAFAKLQYQINANVSTVSGLSSVYDALGAAEEVLGTSEDTYEDDTVFGAKAYADHQIENISISYTEDGTENSMSLSELLAYAQQLEARIAALEPTPEEPEEPTVNVYHVTYVYNGEDLPADILATLPTDSTDYNDNDVITPIAPSSTEIEVDGVTWTFDGWDKASDTINGADITFTGTWSNNAEEPSGE